MPRPKSHNAPEPQRGEVLLYQTDDGRTRLDIRLAGQTLWLTQAQMSELFQTSTQNVTLHLKGIYEEGELAEEATCKDYLQVRSEGVRQVSRNIKHYNLDAVLAVGYRVKSHRGTQFRIWATTTLRDYLVKGFALDDDRLKRVGGDGYFEELLARIRDIRSSEKVFWKKILDIYATSIDYDGNAESSQLFFKTVQNKMHWTAHGHTAAEVVALRADVGKPNMGLTSWSGESPKRNDIAIAKNYLNAEELETLNRVVTAYLEFADLQARNRRPMTMKDWIAKLDDFLKLSGQNVLAHAGRISHEVAIAKAESQYDAYRAQRDHVPNRAEQDFRNAFESVATIERAIEGTIKRKMKPDAERRDKKPDL